MEKLKALILLEKIENQGGVGIVPRYETQEAIVELQEFINPKTCKDCKFADVDDQACTILTHAVLEGDAMPKTFYCSLFEKNDNS